MSGKRAESFVAAKRPWAPQGILSMSGLMLALMALLAAAPANAQWVTYQGGNGPGAGKKIVLVSGDEEYRSEEALTQLGKILAERHGFDCTVLFAVDPATGVINPHVRDNVPGLEELAEADLAFFFTRWRVLPDEQMEHIDAYLRQGKPVIALRTATHAFAPPDEIRAKRRQHYLQSQEAEKQGKKPPPAPVIRDEEWGRYGHYADGYDGPQQQWQDGFGRLVIGERWVAHHGRHMHDSTRGIVAPGAADHPILRGIGDGDIWGPSDVYTVRLPLPDDSEPLLLGQVVKRRGDYDESDPFYGMRPDDGPPIADKNDPMMPIAWVKSYQIPGGRKGRVFTTTMGASTDLVAEGTRRMIVNAVYWACGMEEQIPAPGTNVELVGAFEPTRFASHPDEYWKKRGLKPADFGLRP
jgi:hypothetical protein